MVVLYRLSGTYRETEISIFPFSAGELSLLVDFLQENRLNRANKGKYRYLMPAMSFFSKIKNICVVSMLNSAFREVIDGVVYGYKFDWNEIPGIRCRAVKKGFYGKCKIPGRESAI
jgi:hypothetical protein